MQPQYTTHMREQTMMKQDTNPHHDASTRPDAEKPSPPDGISSLPDELSVSRTITSTATFTKAHRQSIIRRIDVRVVLLLSVMQASSIIDRSQIGLAMITGMGVDLRLDSTKYTTINAVFFAPNVIFQLPANILLRKMGPKKFLSSTTLLWGLTTISHGLVRERADLVALRVVMGVCEAGLIPAAVYLLSIWYPRYNLQKRNAVLILVGTVLAAFSGILAYGISHLGGHGTGPSWWGAVDMKTGSHAQGVAGWRWIFILHGLATCVLSICSWFFLVDFPEKIALGTASKTFRFLTQEEATWAVERIQKDRKDVSPDPFNIREFIHHAWDLKVWAFALLYCFCSTLGYGIGFALPFILERGMGLDLAASQCLTTPPYVASAIVTWLVACYSDKWRTRAPFLLANSCFVIIGLCLIGFVTNTGARYFGVFLAACSSISNAPCILTWQANNIRGQWKRAVVSSVSVALGAVGGVIGSLVFRPDDAPHYTLGIGTCLIAQGLTIVIVLLLCLKFRMANHRAASGGKVIEGLEGFRYTL